MKNLINRLFAPQDDGPTPGQRPRPHFAEDDFSAVYAVGDVHGCLAELKAAEAQIIADSAAFPGRKMIVMLGDYIDRGPNSRQVIDHLMDAPPVGFERIALCGNHDAMFQRFIADPVANSKWLEMGGIDALRSYGIDANAVLERGGSRSLADAVYECVPDRHYDFLANLPGAVVLGRVIFAHAGIRPGIEIALQDDQDLMWIREPFLSEGPGLPVVVVHGHTPGPEPVFGIGRVAIDTGVFATGRLTVLRVALGSVEVL